MANKKNLKGKRFGKLLVLEEGERIQIGKESRLSWLCKCDCGGFKNVQSRDLLFNKTKSCGCLKFNDLSNQKFGQLTPIKSLDKPGIKNRGRIWLCKCDCGNFIELPSQSITGKRNTTCGDKEKHYYDNFYEEIPIVHFNRIKSQAERRKIDFDLSINYLWEVFIKQNKKCALTGIDIFFTDNKSAQKTSSKKTNCSLDRIDSYKGYIKGNVQWVYKKINVMKHVLSNEEFIFLCNKIVNNYYFNNRPNWDEYFLNLAFNVSHRSEDPNIKHGAIIIDENNYICGTGYNGLIRGATSNLVDIYNRDEKRKYMIHAEENAILNCFNRKNNMKMYITGEPCNNCLQRIINFNISEIIIANRIGSITENNETRLMKKKIIKESGIKITKINLKNILLDY